MIYSSPATSTTIAQSVKTRLHTDQWQNAASAVDYLILIQMNKTFPTAILFSLLLTSAHAQKDSLTYQLDNIVVTGTRSTADIENLPATVTVIGRKTLTETQRTNVLPTLAEYVPGLFVTSRGMLGYGVSNGAAGTISMRGLSSSQGRFMVLIDGHPQYQGIFGHSISDSYQTMLADHIEVMRGPASTLYGSNAMGGVINIVTRKMQTDGVKTDIHLGGGSYGTFQGELTNRVRSGKFYSIVSGQYGRTDNNRPRMGFEQYGGYVKLGYDMSKTGRHTLTLISPTSTHLIREASRYLFMTHANGLRAVWHRLW